jgi:hypothetical protein
MLKDVVEVHPIEGYRLRLRFEDGVEGIVDLADFMRFEGVFAPLRDPAYFAEVSVNRDLGSIGWPNGADLDPGVLYARVSGRPSPALDQDSLVK